VVQHNVGKVLHYSLEGIFCGDMCVIVYSLQMLKMQEAIFLGKKEISPLKCGNFLSFSFVALL
jgi:hypothetical protein